MTQAAEATSEVVDVDFVVIGSDAAGLTGAVVAALGGLRVAVLEKTDYIGGTTAVSGGTLWIPNNDREHEVGVHDWLEDAYAYLRGCVGEAGDSSHVEVLAERGAEAARYLEEFAGLSLVPMPSGGSSMDYRPWLPVAKIGGRGLTSPDTFPADLGEWAGKLRLVDTSEWTFEAREYISQRMHLDPPGLERPGASMFSPPPGDVDRVLPNLSGAARLWWRSCYTQRCRARSDRGRRRAHRRPLVWCADSSRREGRTSAHGRWSCHRVRSETVHGPVLFRATTGVLVATGGYSHNETLRKLWPSRKIDHSREIETNTGDGHLLGMAAGAQTAGIGDAWWMPHIPLGSDNAVVNSAGSREDRSLPHTLMVNSMGVRFMNESVMYHDTGENFDSVVGGFHFNFPAWLVFDQAGADRYAMLAWKVDAVAEDKAEWFRSGDTVEELADAMALDSRALRATVERFNGFADSGVDEDIHRDESKWDRAWGDPANVPNPCLAALSKGPFYAVRMYAGTISTRGGLRVDENGRVYSAMTAEAIPGLYAAGNCSNGGPASSYPGPGATLGAAFTFAYVAGRHAAEAYAAETEARELSAR